MSNLKEETPTPDAEHPGVVDPSAGTVETADSAGAYLRASFVRIRGGETVLASGFVAGLAAVVMAELVRPTVGWPWWAAIAAALIVCALIGILQGSLITRIGLPSFVVTLSGLLFWQGVMLYILGDGGSILIQDDVINNIGSGTLSR